MAIATLDASIGTLMASLKELIRKLITDNFG